MKAVKRLIPIFLAAVLAPAMASATVIVNDSWVDAGRTNGVDALDTDWWTSTSSTAIEVGSGYLGLVSGGSGRGIHGTFSAQSLNVGDTLTATFTFNTPATIGVNKSAAFRVGLFNSAGSSGSLAADLAASSGTPNALYHNVTGYMVDMDVNLTAGGEDISIRERTTLGSGQLMAATGDYSFLGGGGAAYTFAANTSYTGVLSLTRTGADTLDITGALFSGATQLSSHTATDLTGIVSSFDVLAFQVGSSTFGSSSVVGELNNGLDFSNVNVQYLAAAPVPEPASVAMMLGGLLMVGTFVRRRNRR